MICFNEDRLTKFMVRPDEGGAPTPPCRCRHLRPTNARRRSWPSVNYALASLPRHHVARWSSRRPSGVKPHRNLGTLGLPRGQTPAHAPTAGPTRSNALTTLGVITGRVHQARRTPRASMACNCPRAHKWEDRRERQSWPLRPGR